MADSFVHLHTHTEYSMLDGAARVPDAVAAAAADGQPALGITDHGNMYGVLDFYQACRDQGIKPIIGTEAYMAGESRHERPRRRGRKQDDSGGDTDDGHKLYYHLTMLAQTDAGYRNLLKLSSLAYMEGFYYKPRMDWELYARHNEGLIVTSGCLGSVVQQELLRGNFDQALRNAARLQDIFGRDNMFIELQDHGIPEQKQCNPQLLDIAKRLRAPLLATNDLHYTTREDAVAHDALLCVQTQSLMSDPDRFKFHGDEHYLKSAGEMRHLFEELPESCDNSLWIAERADVTIEFGKPELPDFPIPEGFEGDDDYLRHLTLEGARKRWGQNLSDEVVERLAYELRVISDMGFSAYFLITWDLIKYARDNAIRVGPGRGSAAGCAVAYCLWITDLDPIKYDLLFERFLNPGRVSMPDIDMDFDDRRRDEMIRYTAERYGREHTAQIITFSSIKARAAVRDAARVLGYPYSVGDKVAKAMPPLVMGRDTPLYACFDEHPKFVDGFKAAGELRQMYDTDPDVKSVVDVAKGLEGLRRGDSIHAAAVVITRNPLTEYLPIQRKPSAGQTIEDAPVVTQYEMNGVEELGLLKMDFLGLRNLSIIDDALKLIEQVHQTQLDIDQVALDDPTTYELLKRGETIGVFQLESAPMRSLMRALAPTEFDDVAALVALYRPGPMAANMHYDYADRKNGRKPVEYLHDDLKEILGETYGLMVYQEAMMRVAQKIAGYSLEEADNLRKACGKKKRELIAQHRVQFVEGTAANGYDSQLGTDLFDIIEPFADYAFNKSHAFGYGLISYQTAYLKANYPVEYMAALLTSSKSNLDKAAVFLNDCRQLGIKVNVPDVNQSEVDFGSKDGEITFGLSAVRNVGEGVVAPIVEERIAVGPYDNFYDFCERVPLGVLNKRSIESLVKAGAFDSLGHPRQGLLTIHEQVIDQVTSRRKERDMGIQTLFGDLGADNGSTFDEKVAIPDLEFDQRSKLKLEKEMLGLYVSSHPLMGAMGMLKRRADSTIAGLTERSTIISGPGGDGGREPFVTLGGVVTGLQRKYTRNGDLMAVFNLEDLETAIEVMVFPRTMTEHGHKLEDDAIILVTGRTQTRGEDEVNFVANSIEVIESYEDDSIPIKLRLNSSVVSDQLVLDLRETLLRHPGDSEVMIHLGHQVIRLPDEFRVDASNGLAGELRALLGADAIIF
ncbi:MAG: DNA polymerase III subunit alpha [Actinomycetia bacterium]|nr:DNA polymerase III subunit alpha [Actinomycetes bacterium]MCP4960266.1 DNA polymerase III subunit alpha [Actinomycetes bacterium]